MMECTKMPADCRRMCSNAVHSKTRCRSLSQEWPGQCGQTLMAGGTAPLRPCSMHSIICTVNGALKRNWKSWHTLCLDDGIRKHGSATGAGQGLFLPQIHCSLKQVHSLHVLLCCVEPLSSNLHNHMMHLQDCKAVMAYACPPLLPDQRALKQNCSTAD